MAVLKKIRERYAKIAGFVIALSLVGFILMDAGSGRFRDLFGADDSVVKVGGEKITALEFDQRANMYEQLRSFFSKGQPLTTEQRAQNREEALRSLIADKQVEVEARKLGITVTDAELKSMYTGADMDQTFQQFFSILISMSNGQIDESQIPGLVQQLEKGTDPQLAEIIPIWRSLKDFVRRNTLTMKYSALITNSVVTPQFVLDRQLQDQTQIAGIRFVKIPFAVIPDADVKVTDADINAYLEKHKSRFRVDQPTRSIEYVSFDVLPNNEDTSRSLGELNRLHDKLATTAVAEMETFVNGGNSDERYNNAWVTKKTFMSPYADTIFAMPVGAVYGPYFDQGSYKITRVVEKRSMPDSVTCRHILVKFADQGQPTIGDTVAKVRIDSIKNAIDNGADFAAMAAAVSDDPGSKDSGGKYEFTLAQRSSLTKEFGDFIFDGTTGEKKVVKVESNGYSGYHYIEILSQKGSEPAAKLATLVKGLAPGEKANNTVYGRANSFAGQFNEAKKFDEAVKKQSLEKRTAENITPGAYTIQGLGPCRELIRWAFEAKIGAVSGAMTIGENRYVVAKVSGEQQVGTIKLTESNRAQMESIVREEMKAKKIAEKFKGTSLEAIAAASGQQVMSVDSVRASTSSIGNIGYSPKVVGYTFNSKFALNTVSPALRSNDGVYYITVTNRSTIPGQDPGMAAQMQMMQDMQARNGLAQSLMGVLETRREVKYKPENIR